MTDYKTLMLKDIAASGRAIISGPFGSNIGKRFFQKSGVPVIRGNNLTTDSRKFRDEGFVFLTEQKANELKADAIENDILFTAAGTIGQVGMIPADAFYRRYVISNKQLRLRVDQKKADPNYVYYWLASPWILKTIKNRNTGSTVPLINLGIIKSLPISMPEEVLEQKKIADVLFALDKKIELNNKINTELEAMAKLIYDFWFVQFDFPDANGKPYKSSGGKMVYNETLKREIPEGWSSDYVENLLAKEPRTRKLPKTLYQTEGAIPVIDQSTEFICGYTDDEKARIRTDTPRVVFGDHTRILKLVDFDFARGADGTQVLLSNNENVPQYFFYHSLLKIDLSNYGYARHFKFLKQTRTIIPDYEIAISFEEKAKSFYSQIKHNIFETKKLEELRDWLLPMLMNGQVTVKGNEAKRM